MAVFKPFEDMEKVRSFNPNLVSDKPLKPVEDRTPEEDEKLHEEVAKHQEEVVRQAEEAEKEKVEAEENPEGNKEKRAVPGFDASKLHKNAMTQEEVREVEKARTGNGNVEKVEKAEKSERVEKPAKADKSGQENK